MKPQILSNGSYDLSWDSVNLVAFSRWDKREKRRRDPAKLGRTSGESFILFTYAVSGPSNTPRALWGLLGSGRVVSAVLARLARYEGALLVPIY